MLKNRVVRRSIAAVIALTVVAAIGWLALRPAAPAPSAFSTQRALADVRFLAEKPRPIASAANTEAREYILAQLRAMGLEPEVQTAMAQKNTMDRRRNAQIALGMVNNIVVLKPGTAPDHARRPALLLATGYDTTERSLGAAATAAPVAAMLEALRMLQAGAPLANDVVVLFADGERVGGLGALGFASQHPLAKHIGLAIRFDSGGSAGAPVLIGASGNDSAAIRGFARAAPNATGSSAMQAIYPFVSGELQMGAIGTLGTARLHIANLEGSNGSGLRSRDTPGRLDPNTVRQMGETMAALARYFGDAPNAMGSGPQGQTPAVHGDSIYFNVPGVGVVSYSVGAVWALTRLTCLLLAIVTCIALHRGDVTIREISDAAIGFLFIAAILVLAAALVWGCVPSLHRGYDAYNYGAGTRDLWFLGGFSALGTALFVLLQRGFRRAVGNAAASLGPLLVAVLLLLLASWKFPHASYVLAWPLIATLIAYGALYTPGANRWPGIRRALVLFAGAAPAVALIAPLVKDVYTLASPEHTALPMIALALLLGMASVLLTAQRRFIVRGLAAASAACFAVASAAAPYGTEPIPQPNRMVYLKDAYTWKSYWMMPAGPLDSWARRFFPPQAQARVQVDAFGYGSPKVWLAPAPRTPVAFPDLATVKDDDDGNLRKVEFTLQSKEDVPFVDLTLSGSDAFRTFVNGRPLTNIRTASWTLNLYGMGGRKLDFRFELESDKRAVVLVHERVPGLPQNGGPERPANALPPVTPMTATTISTDRLVFR
ncbi:M28 family peptidase [Massilia sp. R2A-15]|uniref:M28 family peptidase n=1 Tax=Massilia sp. R2A-15 TaxID=3064278 RepID=UPI002734BB68|nr:M28 family peptidase [Massilia sp. R2A-15]WLI89342.1 M28 family peptidase [Massilia sp. R2A-15]